MGVAWRSLAAVRRRPVPRRLSARVALLACLLGLLLAVPASATAAAPFVDGISDQSLGVWSGNYVDSSSIFSIPFYSVFPAAWVGAPATHIRYARFVTAPDAVAQGGACLQNLVNWFDYATNVLHVTPVIAVWQVTEGGCVSHGVPSTASYQADIAALLGYLDSLGGGASVPYIEAWNEPNSSGVSASQAAAYWTAANSVCATDGCTAIAGDLVDNDADQGSQAFAPGCASSLTYTKHLQPYEIAYVKALGAARPAIWGFHPYEAVNCEQSASLTTFAKNLPSPAGQIWFTEVGAWECRIGQATPRGPTRQQSDASYLVNNLMASVTVGAPTHVFYYEFAPLVYTQSCKKYADSALYMGTTAPGPLYARPAAATIFGPDTMLGAVTGAATAAGPTSATVNGTVMPAGIYEATASFQYGLTKSYGSQTPVVNYPPTLATQAASAALAGLRPNTLYHYRVVVSDTTGRALDGNDATFRTPAH